MGRQDIDGSALAVVAVLVWGGVRARKPRLERHAAAEVDLVSLPGAGLDSTPASPTQPREEEKSQPAPATATPTPDCLREGNKRKAN